MFELKRSVPGVAGVLWALLSTAAPAQISPAPSPVPPPVVSAPSKPAGSARPSDVIKSLAVPGSTGPALDPAESVKAQLEMINRIDTAVRNYASKLGLDDSFVQYCRTELRIRLQEQVKSGNPIFNFAPERIKTAAALAAVVGIRETYERNFQLICLAKAKAALAAVGMPGD